MSNKKNAILFSKVDREDYWVSGGMVFKLENTKTYEDAYNEIKHLLEMPELVNHIIEDMCLEDDLFTDETFKFKCTKWNRELVYEFENEDGDVVEYRFNSDFVLCL